MTISYKRTLSSKLILRNSAFLFGPRQTGKSTLVEGVSPDRKIDLLVNATSQRYSKNPDLLYAELEQLCKDSNISSDNSTKTLLVWIDEVQRVPALLDVVHRTIESLPRITFILTGSSARKLRTGSANLLRGRALDLRLHPLSIEELGEDFKLEQVLKYGALPKNSSLLANGEEQLVQDLLDSYVTTYLEDEIKREAVVKAFDSFQRFLEIAATQAAQQINFSKIADDCQVAVATVQNYYSILEDSLIGFMLPAYHQSVRKQMSQRPKFYFFDNGVTRAIQGLTRSAMNNIERGHMFEQFIIQELRKISDYYKKSFRFYLWHTASGAEVDFLITRGGTILLAIECKASQQISARDLSGLKAFKRTFSATPCVVCAPVEHDYTIDEHYQIRTCESLFKMVKDL